MIDYSTDAERKAVYELNMHASHVLSPEQVARLASDFSDRFYGEDADDSLSVEWAAYLDDIGGYGNMASYARALEAGAEMRAERTEELRRRDERIALARALAPEPEPPEDRRREWSALAALANLASARESLRKARALFDIAGLDITAEQVDVLARDINRLETSTRGHVDNGEVGCCARCGKSITSVRGTIWHTGDPFGQLHDHSART